MAILFDKLFLVLKNSGHNKAFLRSNGIHADSVNRMLKNKSVNTEIIDRICTLLNCQPGDIMEYIPDEESEAEKSN